jgi:hypothetical protein
MLLPVLAFGQIVKTGVVRTVVAAASSHPAILDDADTEAWYIADSDNVTLSADSVTQWNDISGNAKHLTSVTTRYPVFKGDSIKFDANDYLSLFFYGETDTISQPITI